MIKHRILYGLLIGAAFAAGMAHLPGPLLFVLLAGFSAACQHEFYLLAARGGYPVYGRFGLALGVLAMLAVYLLASPCGRPPPLDASWEGVLLMLFAFAVLLRTLADPRAERPFETVAITLFGMVYGPLLLSYYLRLAQWDAPALLATTRGGVFLAFYVSFVVKMSDVGGLAAGLSLGRHKLFPRISPGKSWEGLAGGLLLAAVCSLGLACAARAWQWGPSGIFWTRNGSAAAPLLTLPRAIGLGLLLAGVGVLGDLFESMFKRAVKIKDSRGVVPGMGGLLDMVDSLIFAPALFYFILLWLAS